MALIQAMRPASWHNSGGPATVPNDGSVRTGADQSRSLSVIGTLGAEFLIADYERLAVGTNKPVAAAQIIHSGAVHRPRG
jgi:hypothetical protein